MAATIKGVTFVAVLTTTLTTTMVTCAAETVCKLNVIRCSNITDNDATVSFDVEVSGTHKMIANEITVPANSSVDIVDKNSSIYLQETDLLRGGASAASAVDVLVSYETLID